MKIYKIGDVPLSISSISDILREETNIVLSASAKKKVILNKEYLDKFYPIPIGVNLLSYVRHS